MKIRITDEDIEQGVPCSPSRCPVARAIRRDTGSAASNLTVNGATIWIGNVYYRTPSSAFDFIFDFDHGDPVAPFEFELGLPLKSTPR